MPLPLVGVLQLDDRGLIVDANDDASLLLGRPGAVLRSLRLELTIAGEPLDPATVERGANCHAVATVANEVVSARLPVVVTRLGDCLWVIAHEAKVDVSDRLRAAVSDFQELFGKIPASMLVSRVLRDQHGEAIDYEIVDANDLAIGSLGRRRGDLIGAHLRSVVEPGLFQRAVEMARDLESGVAVVTRETRVGDRWVLATAFRLTGDRIVSLGQDVTDLQRARLIYERAERMEALGELASGVGHDFKNILWGIGLYARTIASTHPAPDPAAGEAAQIAAAVDHGMGLASQLLDFARQGKDTPTVIDVVAVVRAIAPMLDRLLGEQRRLELKASDKLLVAIEATRLEQVLLNLVVNARDAMLEGGTVRIDIGAVTISPAQAAAVGLIPGSFARIDVADDGTGMEPAVSARIFEPYFTTKTQGQGTGLGLATSFAIVTGAGGSIAVESAPGMGSRLVIHLPIVNVNHDDFEAHANRV